MNLSEMVDFHAGNAPDSPALVFEDRTISYGELLDSINKLANAFKYQGVARGDRVAIVMGNRPEFVYAYFAAVRIGAVAVTLNPVVTAYELSHYFADGKPKVVVTTWDQLEKMEKITARHEYLKAIFSTDPAGDAISLAQVDRVSSPDCTAEDMDPDDPAVIIFTAGLLGKALGATLSHRNLDTNANLLRDTGAGDSSDRGLALIPLFHAFGVAVNLLGTVKCGGTVYLVEKVDFPRLVPWLQKAQITYMGQVPMVYYGLLFHPACKTLDLTSVRIAISGGAALAYSIYEAFCARYKIDVLQGYGLTEASPVVSWNNVNIPNKPRTVGMPIPDVMIHIQNDNGNPVPVGESGEVALTGPNVMLGYFGHPEQTDMVIRNGLLYTGDIGHLDKDGYLTLTGLKKDLIITAGFNVYCQEVEEILIRHPQVADAALVGVDDLMRGQVIEALIVPEGGDKPQDREIIRFCREFLSRYKVPRKVTLVKEIIRDAHGKPKSWS